MDWNLKKMWPAAAASLVAFTSLINAADETQIRNLENRVSALEQRKSSNGMINPSARPVVKDGVDLFLQGDVLLWQATQDGLAYAISNSNGTNYVNNGSVKEPHTQWDWGFRLAVGYNMPHDGWDLFLEWTRLYAASNNGNVLAPSGGTLFPTFLNTDLFASGSASTPSELSTGAQSAKGHWRLHLNMLDLELGREFYVSKWLTIRPHAGLRTTWINQRLNVEYDNVTLASGATGQNLNNSLKNNFWGMGLRAGLDGQWGLGGGWSLFSDVAASLMLGHFHLNENFQRTSVTPAETRLYVSDRYRATRLITDMEMGLRWEHSFADDRYALMLQLGWDQHLFLDQNQLMKFASGGTTQSVNAKSGVLTRDGGDLSTQGVSLSARFDF